MKEQTCMFTFKKLAYKAIVNITKVNQNAFVWLSSIKDKNACLCVQRRLNMVKGKQNNKVIRLIVVLKNVHACLQ